MIERPYGSWMRAEPRRRTHTMGNKWLRSGGSILASNARDDRGVNVVTVKDAAEIMHNVNSGIVRETSSQGIMSSLGRNLGMTTGAHNKSKNLVPQIQENKSSDEGNNNEGDFNEIIVSNPKRR
ncbi:hypothetical protein POM88_005960 [Heracleum sosnowskyi]|uniref:Uncharacterized protein n=1 Tax=Heracleum sosnowskyi TaxID=360622 RepID=A0AAD8J1S2_9APIA|nr:hypothetical protein POM88_005960 [Heracleum sosnowskyi]